MSRVIRRTVPLALQLSTMTRREWSLHVWLIIRPLQTLGSVRLKWRRGVGSCSPCEALWGTKNACRKVVDEDPWKLVPSYMADHVADHVADHMFRKQGVAFQDRLASWACASA